MPLFADERFDVSLPHGWPAHPTPVDCERCGGRIHQMSLRADTWCGACLTGANDSLDSLYRQAA